MQPVSTWSKPKILALSIVVALLPLAALLLLANAQAKKEVQQGVAYIAGAVLEKTDSTLNRANQRALQAIGQMRQGCAVLRPLLVQAVILDPAIRAVTVSAPGEGVCSTIREDMSAAEVQSFFAPMGELDSGITLRILESTDMLPGSPVLTFARVSQDDVTVVVTIDGNYVAETLNTLEQWGRAAIAVQVRGREERIEGGAAQGRGRDQLSSPLTLISRTYPIQVSAGMLASRSSSILFDKVWSLLPYALVLSLIVAYLAYRILIFQGSLMAAMGRGIRYGQFYIAYQPIVRLDSAQPVGVEALTRWASNQHGTLSPELLFAIAEEMEPGLALTRHVFELVAKDMQSLPVPRGFQLNVNVSPNHLMGETLEDDLEPLLRVVADKKMQLVLEITERTRLVDEDKVLSMMTRLRRRGVLFALDDFGAAHNSLSYLERYSFDMLKIDKQFVSAIQKERFDHAVLDSIIALAKRLDVALIAEGVETARQRVYLSQTKVELGQGFYFARPMGKADFERWMEEKNVSDAGWS